MRILFCPNSPAGKWFGFVTAVWVLSVTGQNSFSNYSEALKSIMSLTQLQLNKLAIAKDFGKAFCFLAGLASDHLPPSVILLIGAFECFIAHGVQWLVISQKVAPLPYWQMCIIMCLGGDSSSWLIMGPTVVSTRNFRKHRGPVTGICKGYIGLSTAVFTHFSSALLSNSPSSFLLMLSIAPFIPCLVSMIFLHQVDRSVADNQDSYDTKYFNFFSVVSIITAVYLLLYNFSGEHGPIASKAFAAILSLLLVLPLVIPTYAFLKSRSRPASLDHPKKRMHDPLLAQESTNPETIEAGIEVYEGEVESRPRPRPRPALGDEHTIWEALRSLDFWVLFVSFFLGLGSVMAVMNNLGQMGLALGFVGVSTFVSLTSICGFFGRIGSGTISEHFINAMKSQRFQVTTL